MSNEQLNDAGLLAIGLTPEWVDRALAQYNIPPDAASDGVFLQDSPKASFLVALRDNPNYRTSRVVVGIGDTATTYTVTIDATAVATTPATAPVDEVAIEIRDDINADGTVNLVVVASIDPADTTGATVLIEGLATADYSIDIGVAAGTGTLTASANPIDIDALRIWLSPGGIIKSGNDGFEGGWVLPENGDFGALTNVGFAERLDVAGFARGFIELEGINGHASDGGSVVIECASVMIGPTVLAATS